MGEPLLGTIIMEKEKILSRWYEYIGELYNDDRDEIVTEVESLRS